MKKILLLVLTAIIIVPLAAQTKTDITYIANDGFIIENDNKKIAVDALFNTINDDWCDSPSAATVFNMKNGLPPFDNIDLIAITHKHRDHFDKDIVASYMLKNNKTKIICPEQVEKALAQTPKYNLFKNRITIVSPFFFKDTVVTVAGIKIRAMRLEHNHDEIVDKGSNDHHNIVNMGYIFGIGGKKYFHMGDGNPANDREYSMFNLDKEKLYVAFIDRTFFSNGVLGVNIINNYIKPEIIILMHMSSSEKEKFTGFFKNNETIIVPNKMMENIVIEK